MKNRYAKKIQNIFVKISQKPLIILSIQIFWGCMLTIACVLKNWWVIMIAILFNYWLKNKKADNNIKKILIVVLPFLYLLYIWQPLTDGTVSNVIREMASNR